MTQCPKCEKEEIRKDGKANGGKPRYRCLSCNYRFTVSERSTAMPAEMKRNALILYLEGLGFRSIGRYLKVSHVSVYNWIRSFGERLEGIKSSEAIDVVEIDEIHTYIGSKKTTVGSGLLLIELKKDSSTVLLAPGGPKQEKR